MQRLSRTTLLGLAAGSLAALGGCATISSRNPAIGAPPQSATADLAGRAFEMGTVTTSQDVRSAGGISTHCLPDRMYATMLKHDLSVAFTHIGLTQGARPAVIVNISIRLRSFKTNFAQGLRSSQMAAEVRFAGHHLLANIVGAGIPSMFNNGPSWTRQQRIIPAITVDIVRGLRNIQKGKAYTAGYSFFETAGTQNFVPQGYKLRTLPIGILYPMPKSEMEQVTGKTGAQLSAICTANIKAGKIVAGK